MKITFSKSFRRLHEKFSVLQLLLKKKYDFSVLLIKMPSDDSSCHEYGIWHKESESLKIEITVDCIMGHARRMILLDMPSRPGAFLFES